MVGGDDVVVAEEVRLLLLSLLRVLEELEGIGGGSPSRATHTRSTTGERLKPAAAETGLCAEPLLPRSLLTKATWTASAERRRSLRPSSREEGEEEAAEVEFDVEEVEEKLPPLLPLPQSIEVTPGTGRLAKGSRLGLVASSVTPPSRG